MPVGTPTVKRPQTPRTIPNSFPPHSNPSIKRGINANVNRAPTTRAVANRIARRSLLGGIVGRIALPVGAAIAVAELLERRKKILSEAPEGLYVENGTLKGPGVIERINAADADGVHKVDYYDNLDWAVLNHPIPTPLYEYDVYSRREDLPIHWSRWHKTIVIPPGQGLPEPGIVAPNPYPTVPPKPQFYPEPIRPGQARPGRKPRKRRKHDAPGQLPKTDPRVDPFTVPSAEPLGKPKPRPRRKPRPRVKSIAINVSSQGVTIQPNPANARPQRNVRERKLKSRKALMVIGFLFDKFTEGAEILEIILENGFFPRVRRNGKLEREMNKREKLEWILAHGMPPMDWDQLFADLTYNYVEDKVFGYIHGLKDEYRKSIRENMGMNLNNTDIFFL